MLLIAYFVVGLLICVALFVYDGFKTLMKEAKSQANKTGDPVPITVGMAYAPT